MAESYLVRTGSCGAYLQRIPYDGSWRLTAPIEHATPLPYREAQGFVAVYAAQGIALDVVLDPKGRAPWTEPTPEPEEEISLIAQRQIPKPPAAKVVEPIPRPKRSRA